MKPKQKGSWNESIRILKSHNHTGLTSSGVIRKEIYSLSTDLLKVEEVATKLRVKPSWVYTHADALGAYHLGKYLRFSWEQILDRLGKSPRLLDASLTANSETTTGD